MNAQDFYTPKQQKQLAEAIAKGGFVSFDRELSLVWQYLMGLKERELTLMMAGFIGLINEELESFASIYFPVAKEDILSILVEALVNYMNYTVTAWMTAQCSPSDTRMKQSLTTHILTVTSRPNDR